METSNKYILSNKPMLEFLEEFVRHDKKWNEQLFSGYGLNILFPTLGNNAKKKLNIKHTISGKLY